MKNLSEPVMKAAFMLAACVSIIAVALICLFMFAGGMPALFKIGPANFLFGTHWKPPAGLFGILPMIAGSICVTTGALILGAPAGILTAAIMLAIMIIPTIAGVTAAALSAVPKTWHEASLALGASHERSVFFVMLPGAASGILAAVILGMGRALGETMAVVMVAGNQAVFPSGLMSGVRTLTANIVLEMGYAADLHREALIATALVLFIFILLTNLAFSIVKNNILQKPGA